MATLMYRSREIQYSLGRNYKISTLIAKNFSMATLEDKNLLTRKYSTPKQQCTHAYVIYNTYISCTLP